MSVELSVVDGVARVEMNRPEASNALDMTMGRQLETVLRQVAEDDAARVVLLTGRGRIFSAGGDLAAMAAAEDRPGFLQELADQAHACVRIMDTLEKPVVAGVQGAAAGIGLSFVLGADLVVAGRSARFVTAYTSIGMTPDGGQSWLLPRAVGLQRALELTLTPRRLTAEEAADWGIVARVVDDESVEAEALELARTLAAGPATAFGQARRLLRSSFDATLSDHLDVEAAGISAISDTPEARALVDGFVARSARR